MRGGRFAEHRFAEHLAQPLHGYVDAVVELDYRSIGPELAPDFRTRNNFTGPLQQQAEYPEGLLREKNADAPSPQFTGAQVQLEIADANLHRLTNSHCDRPIISAR
jgi:hypothetical protein